MTPASAALRRSPGARPARERRTAHHEQLTAGLLLELAHTGRDIVALGQDHEFETGLAALIRGLDPLHG
ncbi:hypothetical protein QF046_002027 [Microbacterium sp. W4I4]|uniref:hypothetical protein n=1 Tax=Microbacterium sp. W4I4 TaxID=3042295 RepID=UPI002782E735|nr:hypothetical protein [Microbacterium sp. W4I4]MDQ0614386.1 hypothetical protein [Microbacterium sp. W4I4]